MKRFILIILVVSVLMSPFLVKKSVVIQAPNTHFRQAPVPITLIAMLQKRQLRL